nr:MAG TPA: hypothetical protein [Caudoviricetes sp.]
MGCCCKKDTPMKVTLNRFIHDYNTRYSVDKYF